MNNGTLTNGLDDDPRKATTMAGDPAATAGACGAGCTGDAASASIDRLVRAMGLLAALIGLVLVVGAPVLTTMAVLRGLPWHVALPPVGGATPAAYFGLRLFCMGVALIQCPPASAGDTAGAHSPAGAAATAR